MNNDCIQEGMKRRRTELKEVKKVEMKKRSNQEKVEDEKEGSMDVRKLSIEQGMKMGMKEENGGRALGVSKTLKRLC